MIRHSAMSTLTQANVLNLSIPERIQLVEDIWDTIAEVPEEVRLTDEQKTELALYLGRRHAGLSLRVLAAETKLGNYQTVAQAIHRMTLRTENDSACRNLVAKAIKCLNVKT